MAPTPGPTISLLPTTTPTPDPTISPLPTQTPTPDPTISHLPTTAPSPNPTISLLPTQTPTPDPTISLAPTRTETFDPTISLLPTQTPTPDPTVSLLPTSAPTQLPSAVPTLFNPPLTPGGEFDPTKYLALARPVITAADGSVAFAITDVFSSANASFARKFGLLSGAAPGSSFDFTATVADGTYELGGGSDTSGSTLQDPVGRVEVLLKTNPVYWDETTMEVSYQVFDEVGRTVVLTTRLTSTMNVVLDSDTSQSTGVVCTSPDAATGVGVCTLEVPQGWFSTDQALTASFALNVTYDGTTSNVASVASDSALVLARKPTFAVLSSSGMVATFPHHPVLPLDYFDVPVSAHTGGQDLSLWVLGFVFNESLLEYVSTTTAGTYTPAVVTTGAGTVSMSTSGLASGISTWAVTGTNVSVATLRFRVLSPVDPATYSNVFSFTVTQMINQYSIGYASSLVGQVNDQRGGAQTSAQLKVLAVEYVGIWAHAPLNELVNTAALTGTSLSTTLSVVAVSNWAGVADTSVPLSSVNCSLVGGSGVATMNGCVLSVDDSHTAGSSGVTATIKYGGFETSAAFRVWFPVEISHETSDSELGLVIPGHGAGDQSLGHDARVQAVLDAYSGTCGSRYQEATLKARAKFDTTAGSGMNVTVDVSHLATFVSSSPAVASVSDLKLHGLSPGSTTVGFGAPTNAHVGIAGSDATLAVVVTNSPAYVEKLTLVVFTDAEWTGPVGPVALTGSTVEPTIQFQHVLTAEGDTAKVLAYAEFNDGTYEDVSSEIVLESTSANVGVTQNPATVFVEVGAALFAGPAIVSTWEVCNGSATLVSNKAVVMLNMPDPVSVEVTVSGSKIAKTGDGSTLAPFSVPDSVTVTVTVTYDDGSTRDFSLDDRTRIRLADDGSKSIGSLSGNVLSVLSNATSASQLASSGMTLLVDFPGVFAINATASVTFVELASVTANTVPYPTVSGWSSGNVQTLRYIACSGTFQRLEARATGVLSDGTTLSGPSFYRRVTFSSSNSAVGTFSSEPCWSSNCRGLVPTTPGSITVTSSFGGFESNVSVTVSSGSASVTGLAIADDIGSSSTLSGVAGATDTVLVTASFDDGTSLDVAASGADSSSWILPQSFLNFSSSVPGAIGVTASGVARLLSNHLEAVTLSASDSCNSSVVATRNVYANLAPDTYDVDLGATSGPALTSVAVGATFAVPVRVQGASDEDVTAFQIRLQFDPTKIMVASDDDCAQGSDWSSSFECTTNDPVNEVLLVGSCGLSPSSGCDSKGLSTVATVTFTAVSAGTTSIQGVIVKVKDDVITVSNANMFAGAASMVVTTSRRRRHLLASSSLLPADVEEEKAAAGGAGGAESWVPNHRTPRRAPVACADLLGDTNGDCVFDVEDVEYLQYYIGGAFGAGSLSAQQLTAMDPNLDGDSDGVDIAFLMKVVANKYRFMSAFTFDADPFAINATMLTKTSEPATAAATNVSFEIACSLNQGGGLGLSIGARLQDTADGVFVEAVEDDSVAPGVHRIVAKTVAHTETNLGVVVMVSTLDGNGATDSSRQFSYYCSRLLSGCVAVYGNSPSAFKPYYTVSMQVRTWAPTAVPNPQPTAQPTISMLPTGAPSAVPFPAPTISFAPSLVPTDPDAAAVIVGGGGGGGGGVVAGGDGKVGGDDDGVNIAAASIPAILFWILLALCYCCCCLFCCFLCFAAWRRRRREKTDLEVVPESDEDGAALVLQRLKAYYDQEGTIPAEFYDALQRFDFQRREKAAIEEKKLKAASEEEAFALSVELSHFAFDQEDFEHGLDPLWCTNMTEPIAILLLARLRRAKDGKLMSVPEMIRVVTEPLQLEGDSGKTDLEVVPKSDQAGCNLVLDRIKDEGEVPDYLYVALQMMSAQMHHNEKEGNENGGTGFDKDDFEKGIDPLRCTNMTEPIALLLLGQCSHANGKLMSKVEIMEMLNGQRKSKTDLEVVSKATSDEEGAALVLLRLKKYSDRDRTLPAEFYRALIRYDRKVKAAARRRQQSSSSSRSHSFGRAGKGGGGSSRMVGNAAVFDKADFEPGLDVLKLTNMTEPIAVILLAQCTKEEDGKLMTSPEVVAMLHQPKKEEDGRASRLSRVSDNLGVDLFQPEKASMSLVPPMIFGSAYDTEMVTASPDDDDWIDLEVVPTSAQNGADLVWWRVKTKGEIPEFLFIALQIMYTQKHRHIQEKGHSEPARYAYDKEDFVTGLEPLKCKNMTQPIAEMMLADVTKEPGGELMDKREVLEVASSSKKRKKSKTDLEVVSAATSAEEGAALVLLRLKAYSDREEGDLPEEFYRALTSYDRKAKEAAARTAKKGRPSFVLSMSFNSGNHAAGAAEPFDKEEFEPGLATLKLTNMTEPVAIILLAQCTKEADGILMTSPEVVAMLHQPKKEEDGRASRLSRVSEKLGVDLFEPEKPSMSMIPPMIFCGKQSDDEDDDGEEEEYKKTDLEVAPTSAQDGASLVWQRVKEEGEIPDSLYLALEMRYRDRLQKLEQGERASTVGFDKDDFEIGLQPLGCTNMTEPIADLLVDQATTKAEDGVGGGGGRFITKDEILVMANQDTRVLFMRTVTGGGGGGAAATQGRESVTRKTNLEVVSAATSAEEGVGLVLLRLKAYAARDGTLPQEFYAALGRYDQKVREAASRKGKARPSLILTTLGLGGGSSGPSSPFDKEDFEPGLDVLKLTCMTEPIAKLLLGQTTKESGSSGAGLLMTVPEIIAFLNQPKKEEDGRMSRLSRVSEKLGVDLFEAEKGVDGKTDLELAPASTEHGAALVWQRVKEKGELPDYLYIAFQILHTQKLEREASSASSSSSSSSSLAAAGLFDKDDFEKGLEPLQCKNMTLPIAELMLEHMTKQESSSKLMTKAEVLWMLEERPEVAKGPPPAPVTATAVVSAATASNSSIRSSRDGSSASSGSGSGGGGKKSKTNLELVSAATSTEEGVGLVLLRLKAYSDRKGGALPEEFYKALQRFDEREKIRASSSSGSGSGQAAAGSTRRPSFTSPFTGSGEKAPSPEAIAAANAPFDKEDFEPGLDVLKLTCITEPIAKLLLSQLSKEVAATSSALSMSSSSSSSGNNKRKKKKKKLMSQQGIVALLHEPRFGADGRLSRLSRVSNDLGVDLVSGGGGGAAESKDQEEDGHGANSLLLVIEEDGGGNGQGTSGSSGGGVEEDEARKKKRRTDLEVVSSSTEEGAGLVLLRLKAYSDREGTLPAEFHRALLKMHTQVRERARAEAKAITKVTRTASAQAAAKKQQAEAEAKLAFDKEDFEPGLEPLKLTNMTEPIAEVLLTHATQPFTGNLMTIPQLIALLNEPKFGADGRLTRLSRVSRTLGVDLSAPEKGPGLNGDDDDYRGMGCSSSGGGGGGRGGSGRFGGRGIKGGSSSCGGKRSRTDPPPPSAAATATEASAPDAAAADGGSGGGGRWGRRGGGKAQQNGRKGGGGGNGGGGEQEMVEERRGPLRAVRGWFQTALDVTVDLATTAGNSAQTVIEENNNGGSSGKNNDNDTAGAPPLQPPPFDPSSPDPTAPGKKKKPTPADLV